MRSPLRVARSIALVAVAFVATPAWAADCGELTALHWLADSWTAWSDGKRIHEEWQVQATGTLEGTGRTWNANSELVLEEKLRIEVREGRPVYIADVPSNPEPVAFALASCDADSWTFENPEHDFPQRIVYSRSGEEAFTARITDLDDQGFELAFQRSASRTFHD